jgi:hypothetical protein
MTLKLVGLLVGLAILLAGAIPSFPSTPSLFATEQQAQLHCPSDTVIWLNLPSGIYHFRGERWFGRTNSGAYVCKGEADQAGDRATRNGL